MSELVAVIPKRRSTRLKESLGPFENRQTELCSEAFFGGLAARKSKSGSNRIAKVATAAANRETESMLSSSHGQVGKFSSFRRADVLPAWLELHAAQGRLLEVPWRPQEVPGIVSVIIGAGSRHGGSANVQVIPMWAIAGGYVIPRSYLHPLVVLATNSNARARDASQSVRVHRQGHCHTRGASSGSRQESFDLTESPRKRDNLKYSAHGRPVE